jgi:hypothetical protein
MSCSFDEFHVGHVQHQFSRALGPRAEESLQPHFASQLRRGDEPCLRLEGHRAQLRVDLAPGTGLVLLRLVLELEFDYGDSGGGEPQGAQFYDFSADP